MSRLTRSLNVVNLISLYLTTEKQGQCHIIDIVVPGDNQVVDKEKEKLAKY